MSSSIWTRCAGDSELRALRLAPWRAVEAQHQLSTRKLVASAEEQIVLEELIDGAKPPDRTHGRRHYLLTTPFRYPPLRHGTRFGTRHERGIWYGSETRETAFADVAYYRLVFLEGTHADLGALSTPLTVFRARARTSRGVDLTAAPFDAHRRAIASPVRYDTTQALGAAMRAAGVELFRYPSARDPRGGVNVGAFTPDVFGRSKPRDLEPWQCIATREMVELAKRDYFGREVYTFARDAFLVGGRLPAPSV
jgi:hypothetical protein